MSDGAESMSYYDGTEFAIPDPMQHPPETNNIAARVRTLEAVVRQLMRQLELHQQSTDQQIKSSHATWQLGIDEIMQGVRKTHENLYAPVGGGFARLLLLEQAQLSQGKFKAWLVGFATSGLLLIAGALLGKLLGVK